MMKRFTLSLLSLIILLGSLGFVLQSRAAPDPVNPTAETYRQLELFGDVFERVKREYVEEAADKDLIEAAINGMLTSLDPHSAFLNTDSFKDMRIQTRGEFGGLGIEVTMENGWVKVVSPIDDTPAFRAGLKAGDFIIRIDDEDVMGMTLSDAVDKMRGLVGTDIIVKIAREGEAEPFDVTITRDVIRIQSVRSRVEGNIGYLRITTFNEKVRDGLVKAMEEIEKELGDELQGYVLDLRNNPGGLLDQAIYTADLFLEEGEIVSTRSRDPEATKRFFAKDGDFAEGLPIVVLINGGSASASEIVAGALQDHKRGLLLGTKSFGKGSVQTVISMGLQGAIRLTTARYYTPSGRSIQAEGIEPDIEVKPAKIEEIDTSLQRRREADLRGALDKKDIPLPAGEGEGEDSETDEPVDYQLLRALDLLKGIARYNRPVTAATVEGAANDNAAVEAESTESAAETEPMSPTETEIEATPAPAANDNENNQPAEQQVE